MSVYFEKSRGGWRYDFQFEGRRYKSPRCFDTKGDAREAEAVLRRRVKRAAAGLEPTHTDSRSVSFTDWANVYLDYVERQARDGRIKRPDIIEGNLRVILRFWGRRQPDDDTPEDEAPCHDLALDDPIRDPAWLRRFDEWMDDRGVAGWTKYHYLTTMSRLYWLALHPEYRQEAGAIAYNPFIGRPRPRGKRRTVTVTPEQITKWITKASYHVRLAMSIAALAPKLRLANILALKWGTEVNLDDNTITVWDHKEDDQGTPLVTAINTQLRKILEDARRRHPNSKHVILYRGAPVKTIDGGVQAAALAAGIRYGRESGATFHTLRHSMSTLLARLNVPPDKRQQVMGHRDIDSTLWYTHLDVEDQRAPLEELGAQLPLVSAVTTGPTRQTRRRKPAVTAAPQRQSQGRIRQQGRTEGRKSSQKRGVRGRPRAVSGLRRGPAAARKKAKKTA